MKKDDVKALALSLGLTGDMVATNTIKANPNNPRVLRDEKFALLKKSIEEFPKMLALRPIVTDADGVVLGGNMRLRALQDLGYNWLPAEWVRRADTLTEDERRQFVIKDNASFGEWDWDALANDWHDDDLRAWGVDVWDGEAEEKEKKMTEILSGLEYDTMYYEPAERPDITLEDCIDFDKFDAKVAALDEYELTDDEKRVLTWFAYRFIRIDFERVASYYAFNAREEVKKAIERLRLVLTDTSVRGFVEDDLLRIMEMAGDKEG